MSKQSVVGFLILILASACTFTPHEVSITARAPTTPSEIGAGIAVELQVIDDRDSTVVGQRGVGMIGADITAQSVLRVLEEELTGAFEANSFTVLPAGTTADAEVEVRLRAFKFFIESGFFSGAKNTSVVVSVEAEKNGQDFDRTYRSSSEEAILFVPGGESIDAKLNAALSVVLAKIIGDRELMAFLVQRPGDQRAKSSKP